MPITSIYRDVPLTALKLHPFIQDFRHEDNLKSREARVQWLVENWNEELVGRIVTINGSNGCSLVIDGGHRMQAARILAENGDRKDAYLPVEDLRGVEWDDRAALVQWFLGRMDTRGWAYYNKFALQRDAGIDPPAAIESICRKHGSRTAPAGGGQGYACAKKLVEAHALGVLDEVVHALEGAWSASPHVADARHQVMVGAMSEFMLRYRNNAQFDIGQFIEKLTRIDPREVLVQARSRSKAFRVSFTKYICVQFVDIYNRKRRNPIPEFSLRRPK